MTSTPGSDIVETAAEATVLPLPPLLVLERVREFLDLHGLGSGEKIRAATEAVASLRRHLKVQDEEIKSEREKKEARERARLEREQRQ